jgi:hypothetical protein
MRTRVWNNLANIKFKALYTSECSNLAGTCGRIYSFLFAFTSTSSAATWAIWNRYPFFWAFIVGFSQLLSVIKPHIPFVKNDKAYLVKSDGWQYGNHAAALYSSSFLRHLASERSSCSCQAWSQNRRLSWKIVNP